MKLLKHKRTLFDLARVLKLSMQRLDESELSKPPSEVLEIICKLGKGSYGSVYKAKYKANDSIIAVKKVPVDSDLADIVKEISIMQQCDSPFIVKCYGSLFDSQDLWICMEYCGAGSIADIMRLRNKPLEENQIATVLHYSLKGLDYLHQMRKIHRDIKAGNILLLDSGTAKLADFGVAGQLSDTLAKRNTVIGTPYWMAPEVIQEIGYNCSADIWSLGITAIEMADGKPPLADIHPMRALFMIPSQPAPALRKPANWSPEFRAFVASCLAKTPESRPTAAALLQTEYIRNAESCSILLPLIQESKLAKEKRSLQTQQSAAALSEIVADNLVKKRPSTDRNDNQNQIRSQEDEDNLRTMVRQKALNVDHNKEINFEVDGAATLVSVGSNPSDGGSFIRHDSSSRPLRESVGSYTSENLDTMVVNEAESEEDSGSVVVHDDTVNSNDLDNHEREQREAFELLAAAITPGVAEGTLTRKANEPARAKHSSPSNEVGLCDYSTDGNADAIGRAVPGPFAQRPFAPFSRALQQSGFYPHGMTNDHGTMNRLTYHELEQLLAELTNDLETELRNLAVRYHHKRQPLLDAIAEKTAQTSRSSNEFNDKPNQTTVILTSTASH